jgi:ligand-binding sensor protein
MLNKSEGQIVLTKEQIENLREIVAHEGWKIYKELLEDLRDEITLNFKSRSIKSTEDLIEVAKDQARLELLENVIIPLIRDYLEGEEEK